MSFLKLIRFPNLFIVALTQLLLYFYILIPGLEQSEITLVLPPKIFISFVLITVLISAGGFIINDILDYTTDLINKPDKVIINKKIRLQTSYWYYFVFNLLGFTLAFYIGLYIEKVELVGLFPLAMGGLYLYSKFLKKMPLLGNLLIAAYCAGVAWIVWFSQNGALESLLLVNKEKFFHLRTIFLWYTSFAFLSTLFRELVKDIEDIQGDRQSGFNTAPIAWGVNSAKIIALLSGLILIISLLFLILGEQALFIKEGVYFIISGLIIPTFISLILLFKAQKKKQFHQVSQLIKWIMLAGLLLLLFIAH